MRCGEAVNVAELSRPSATLRAGGFADTEIFEVVFVPAYFNYPNRAAEGLGIEPEG